MSTPATNVSLATMTRPITAYRPILSVIGPHSKSGKTLFVTHLLRSITGLGCLKISPAHDDHNDFDDGSVPGNVDYFFEDRARLRYPGKDTAIYLDAGARQVERLRHRGNALAAGLVAALKRFEAGIPVVVESSSAVEFLDPFAVVLVVRPPIREMKPATQRVLARVTDLLVNASRQDNVTSSAGQQLSKEYNALRPAHTWHANLASESPPRKMLARLTTLLVKQTDSDESD